LRTSTNHQEWQQMSRRQDEEHDRGGPAVTQLLDALSRLIRTSRAAGHRQQAEFGLSGTPLGILKSLAVGDARAGDLAVGLQIAPSVISRALVPLEQGGLVERRTDPDDARASRLGLTTAGEQRLEAARRDLADRFTPLLADWDPAEIATLTGLMGRLEETLSTELHGRGHGGHEQGLTPQAPSALS
jgi:DNA-binding MarR family transcriptional regulator